jgi:hypothetical protein
MAYPKKIEFEVDLPDMDGDGCSPYVQLVDPARCLQYMRNGDVIVAPAQIIINITYPLRNPAQVRVVEPAPITRRRLAELISQAYQQVYREEEASKSGHAKGNGMLLNRRETNGKYGIWGHDLGDLDLHTVILNDGICDLLVDS